jgi:hypothetical protein
MILSPCGKLLLLPPLTHCYAIVLLISNQKGYRKCSNHQKPASVIVILSNLLKMEKLSHTPKLQSSIDFAIIHILVQYLIFAVFIRKLTTDGRMRACAVVYV